MIGSNLTSNLWKHELTPLVVYWLPSRRQRGATGAELSTIETAITSDVLSRPDWDGYGALALAPETKENALKAIERMLLEAPSPEFSPNPNGTISFEWATNNGSAHLEIGRTKFSFYVRPGVGNPIFFEGAADQVSRLHGSLLADVLFPLSVGAPPATRITYSGNV